MTRRPVSPSALVAGLLLLVLLAFHAQQIPTASVLYDDAFIASVAKNVALGVGYKTTYHVIDPFDPEISTGASIIVPTAALMTVFGNQFWVPRLSASLAIWLSLLAFSLSLRRHVGSTAFYRGIAVLTLAIILFATSEFGLLGDVPAALLVGTCFALLVDPLFGHRKAGVLAGLALGLATTSKLIAVFALPVAIFWSTLGTGEGRWRWRRVAWCVVGWLVPLVAFSVYQLTESSGDLAEWWGIQTRMLSFLAAPASLSGLGQLRSGSSILDVLIGNVERNGAAFVGYFGNPLAVVPGVAATIAALSLLMRSKVMPPHVKHLLTLLAGVALLHLIWWLVISPTGWLRHLLPGILYFSMFGGVVLAAATHAARRITLIQVLGGSLSLVLVLPIWLPKSEDLSRFFLSTFTRQPRLTALISTRDEIERLQKDSAVILVGCGWWVPRDLEYLLPGVNNFRDCLRLTPEEVTSKRVLLVVNGFYNWERSPLLDGFQAECEKRPVYRRDPFVISECQGLPK